MVGPAIVVPGPRVNPKTESRRATKLVKTGKRLLLWLVDATEPNAIRCRRWKFIIRELAEAAEKTMLDGIASGARTDVLMAAVSFVHHDGEEAVCSSAEHAIKFLAGDDDAALRQEARIVFTTLRLD